MDKENGLRHQAQPTPLGMVEEQEETHDAHAASKGL